MSRLSLERDETAMHMKDDEMIECIYKSFILKFNALFHPPSSRALLPHPLQQHSSVGSTDEG